MHRLACALLLLISGCGDSRDAADGSVPGMDGGVPPGSDGGGVDASGTDSGAPPDGDLPGSDAGGTDGGGPGPSLALCVLGCGVDADCTTSSPAFDADNYRCDAGACVYTGCNTDAECRTTFSNPDYVCRDPGTGLASCLESCATSADCGSGTPAFDADNYRCDGGVCIYTGCNTDAECESTFIGGYGCFDVEPPATPLPLPTATRNCVRRCATADDCATDSGAFGADNYRCEAAACRWEGCNDDAECRTSLSSSAYVCR